MITGTKVLHWRRWPRLSWIDMAGTAPFPVWVSFQTARGATGMTDGAQGKAGIKVFLLDDHEIVRRGVRDMLEAMRGSPMRTVRQPTPDEPAARSARSADAPYAYPQAAAMTCGTKAGTRPHCGRPAAAHTNDCQSSYDVDLNRDVTKRAKLRNCVGDDMRPAPWLLMHASVGVAGLLALMQLGTGSSRNVPTRQVVPKVPPRQAVCPLRPAGYPDTMDPECISQVRDVRRRDRPIGGAAIGRN